MMNRQKIILGCFFLIALTSSSLRAQAFDIIGKWKFKEKPRELMITQEGKHFEGKAVNPKAEYKEVKILKNLHFDTKQQAYVGTLNSPKKNMSLDVTIYKVSSDKLKMVGKKGFMTKTFHLIKIKP